MARTATRRALVSRPAEASGNWWEVDGQTCVAAYQAIGAASLEASYVNLANPGTYDCTAPGTAPGFDSSYGWQFTQASSTFLNTGWTRPATMDVSVVVRVSDFSATGAVFGAVAYTGNRLVFMKEKAQHYYVNGVWSAAAVASGSPPAGVHIIARKNAYTNGSLVAHDWKDGTSALPALYIGAQNNNGTTNSYITVRTQAMAIYASVLTTDDVAALTTRMAALS